MNNNVTNSREQFIKSLIDKITNEIKEENQKQIIEFKNSILEKINNDFIFQSRPNYYNNEGYNNNEYSYQEEIEHKNFEHFLKTGNIIGDFGKKALQGSPIYEGGTPDYTNGYALVSSILQKEILKSLSRHNSVRKLATVKVVPGDKTEYLRILDKIDNVGWVSETDDRLETYTPKIDRLAIKLHEIYALPKVSRNLLLNDSTIDIASWLKEEVSNAFARTELLAFLNGDGESKPLGILHDNAKISRLTTKTAKTVEFQDLLDLYNSLDFNYREGACFLMNPRMQALIYGLKDPNGNSLLQHSFKESFPNTLFGCPIYLTDFLDEGDASGHQPIIFGNFKIGYLVIDCALNTFMRDEITEKQWVKFYTSKRVGGTVTDNLAFKVLKIK